jgi:hypothetical protein
MRLEPFEAYSLLTDALPPLVRKQRRLEAQILPLAALAEEEKTIRSEIDGLLIEADIKSNDGVTCLGYDVVHHERAGSTRMNQEVLYAQLVAAGLTKAVVDKILAEATERGDPSAWATVKPSKGSKVRR